MAAKTAALAAFIQARNMRAGGALITLPRVRQLWQLPIDPNAPTVPDAIIERLAQRLRMPVGELQQAIAAFEVPASPAPVAAPVPAPVVDDHEIDISFDDLEATPTPEAPAPEADPTAKPAKPVKAKKPRKKKI
jgi:hypothetical protein